MTNSEPNRLDQIEALLQETIQITRSNARAIEATNAAMAANNEATNAAIAATNHKVDGLVQVITEFSIKTDANLTRLNESIASINASIVSINESIGGINTAITGINATNERLEQILLQLSRYEQNP